MPRPRHNLLPLTLLLAACTAPHHPQPAAAPGTPPTRAAFLHLLARPTVPLAPEFTPRASPDPALLELHFSYQSDAANRVPGLLVKPLNSATQPPQRRPVVICLHGTGGNKENMLPLLRTVAAKGFLAIAIDGRYHGERTKAGALGQPTKNAPDYQDALLAAYHNSGQHPFFFDTVYDVTRLVDYLQTRPDVDPARIALFGISKGGIETYLAAAADPRIAAAVPCIGVESFAYGESHNAWQLRIATVPHAFAQAAKDANATPSPEFAHDFYTHVAPGLDAQFDGPAMLPLIAPRPLLIINGELDARNPLPGLDLCLNATRPLYHAAHADDNLQVLIEKNTAHKVTEEAQSQAIAWLVAHLHP